MCPSYCMCAVSMYDQMNEMCPHLAVVSDPATSNARASELSSGLLNGCPLASRESNSFDKKSALETGSTLLRRFETAVAAMAANALLEVSFFLNAGKLMTRKELNELESFIVSTALMVRNCMDLVLGLA